MITEREVRETIAICIYRNMDRMGYKTLQALAIDAKLGTKTLYAWASLKSGKGQSPRIKTLIQLANFFDIPMSDFFER